ncbi:MAG TPA: hypothetical protein PKA27_08255 [Fimbriimonadaceae bacterium]|nr:hypothetical protein [Fimbriimonadaceae bacterium]
MTTILGPFARLQERGLDIYALNDADPASASAEIEAVCAEILDEIRMAPGDIVYVLRGAEPEYSTPMQYGGLFLEQDRALLASASGHNVVLRIEGGDEVYADFLEDLPCAQRESL